ncbi:MAG TPA: GGDEF domain-containing protein [Burkholderiales bacterium]|nr:GGDEF domain-containing protein [Burkholderiales bacterium]
MRRGLAAVGAAALPLALLASAWWLVGPQGVLPPAAAVLLPAAAYAALAVALLIGLAFHRGRIVFAALGLAVAYHAFGQFVAVAPGSLAARGVFAGLCILAPAVLATLAWLEERGTLSLHALPRLGLIAAAVGFVWWIVVTGRDATIDWAHAPLTAAALPFETPIPQVGLAAIALGLVGIGAAAVVQRSAVVGGLGWALAAFALSLHFSGVRGALPIFTAAAGLLLVVAVLRETYRLAFRDELTRLPSRRALNERLKAVGRRYAVAMVDVDHFKSFNDSYGHDVGDQVLRMVAARLARVGGGGQAFRYGGEEFTVLFPGKGSDEVLPHLEALRADIDGYRMAIRGSNRPRRKRAGKRRRSGASSAQTVSVTVSIGVAERSDRYEHPEAVIKAADKSLYRAKRAGRNQVVA